MKASRIIATFVFLLGISLQWQVEAQEAPPANPYSGDIWTRSALTGDWGGLRNRLADKGVTLDLSVTQIGQGVVNGGKSGAWQYGGHGDIVMNVDSGKLGLWPGGFLNLEAEGSWASSVNGNTGALMPVNSIPIFPALPGDNFNLIALNFSQFLSPYFGLTIGKYATISLTAGDMNEFAHGKGTTQFMNLAFNFNPLLAFTVPYPTLGTGVIVLPTKDPKEAIVSLMVLQANGQANTSGFGDLNGNDILVVAEGRVRTDFFDLTGHQVFGTTFSNKKFTSIDQRLGNVIETGSLAEKKGSWNIYYNFDQYLYQPNKGVDRGVGVFGRLGVSDGNPNLMKFFGSFGVGGKGVFESRPLDQFGLGYYFINISNPTIQGPLQTRSFLRDEYGFEAYYNFAITPWLKLTPDIQIVRGAQKHKVTNSPLPVLSNQSIGTSTTLGLRLQMVF
jgi:porin